MAGPVDERSRLIEKGTWKPAVANGGNTDERARANWTELCWDDYAVRGQGATTVYLTVQRRHLLQVQTHQLTLTVRDAAAGLEP